MSNMEETMSKEYPVEYGTPQGSCLGPLIFLIFVNDLHLHLQHSEGVQFADDTTLLFKHRNLNYLQFCIESELLTIQDWFNANKLTLNVEKSSYLLYHNRKQPIPNFKIALNGVEIPRTSCAKFLRVWLDDKLKWNTHVNKLISKLKCGIGMVSQQKPTLHKGEKTIVLWSNT